ncbi:MAG: DUF6119 family protein [Eubacteriales bacterium]
MAHINIYKIENEKKEDFFTEITDYYVEKGAVTITVNIDGIDREFDMCLYYDPQETEEDISWQWVLDSFETDLSAVTKSNPRGIVSIEVDENVYAVSFSYAYFFVDRYCDRDFPFDYGRRLEYSNIKITALTNPNLQRNKTVNSFIDYININFDSGEALTKLNANQKLAENFELFKSSIEIGNSIKFAVDAPSLEKLAKIILYIEDTIDNKPELVKIPTFDKIKDSNEIELLTQNMLENIDDETEEIEFSEYSIHATNIIFTSSDQYEIRYSRKNQFVDGINNATIREFAAENNLDLKDVVEKGKICVYRDGISVYTEQIFNHIFSTNEAQNTVLQDGKWYRYNNDYLIYINNSILEIQCINYPYYDLHMDEYMSYIDSKYSKEKDEDEYEGMIEEDIKNKLRNKYYRERYYNDMLTNQGFENFDRDLEKLDSHKYEVMDLYKDDCMYTVKIGKSSAKLCYAIDQSLLALDLYHQGRIELVNGIKEIALLLILDRKTRLPIEEENVRISDLKMIILKNKLDYWKKEVRLKGYLPKIYINYVV